MPSPARAALESLLQARQLDRTLTTAIRADVERGPSGITALDAQLGGGFPRGELSELIGPCSSGRTSVLIHMLAAATRRGELVALIDALDMFDVDAAAAAGVVLDRLLWIRGHVVVNPGLCRDVNQRALEQTVRAVALVLQAGNFGLVAFDVAEAPADAIRRLPFTTWLRLQRMVEGRFTMCVLVGSHPMARSSAGLSVHLTRSGAAGSRFRKRLFDGLDIQVRIVRARSCESTGPDASTVDAGLGRAMTAARPDGAQVQVRREGNGAGAVDAGLGRAMTAARPDGAQVQVRREGNGADAVDAGLGRAMTAARPDGAQVQIRREGNGPSASGVGVGPHALNNVCVSFSTTCC